MRYLVEIKRYGELVRSLDVQSGLDGIHTIDFAIRLINENGARTVTYYVVAVSKDAGTREVVAAGKPGYVVPITAVKVNHPPAAFQYGDKVRVTYETEVLRISPGTGAVTVVRPGTGGSRHTLVSVVPAENIELIERDKPEWWPPQVGDVIQHTGNWGRGTVVNPDPAGGPPDSFGVYRHHEHRPGGGIQTFSLTNCGPNEWKLVLPSAHRKDSKS